MQHLQLRTKILISQEERERAWNACSRSPSDAARWMAYLNHLCWQSLQPWIAENSDLTIEIFPPESQRYAMWESVGGTGISFGHRSIILIPSEANPPEELCVPQAWLEPPHFAGDYYLAVQINVEEGWLRPWGYGTYQQLKQPQNYDPIDCTYCLERQELITALEALWVAIELEADVGVAVFTQPQPSVLNARTQPLLIQLSQWWRDRVEEGWRVVEDVTMLPQRSLSFSFRTATERPLEQNLGELIERVAQQIETLTRSENDERCRALIKQLTPDLERLVARREEGASARALLERSIRTLGQIASTTEQEETRWTAVESLFAIDPQNPLAGKRQIKDLGMQFAGQSLALMVSILEKPQQKIAVLVRLYALGENAYLPQPLELVLFDEGETQILVARSRERDRFIQLKFVGSIGERFGIGLQLAEISMREEFQI